MRTPILMRRMRRKEGRKDWTKHQRIFEQALLCNNGVLDWREGGRKEGRKRNGRGEREKRPKNNATVLFMTKERTKARVRKTLSESEGAEP